MSNQKLQIEDMKKFIQMDVLDTFVTLTFNKKMDKINASVTLEKVRRAVERELFGRRTSQRLIMVPFFEYSQSNHLHYHIMIKKPDSVKYRQLKDSLEKHWMRTPNAGKYSMLKKGWFQDIRTDEDRDKVFSYSSLKSVGFNPNLNCDFNNLVKFENSNDKS